jgi:hypothetical protein
MQEQVGHKGALEALLNSKRSIISDGFIFGLKRRIAMLSK